MTKSPATRSSSAIRTTLTLAAAPIAIGLLTLTLACNSGGNASADVEKAQIAVRANPALELVATDERQSVLTVRVRQSGRVMTVSVADVIAGVAFRDMDAPAAAQTNGQGGGNASGSSRDQRVAVATPGGAVSVQRSGNGVNVTTPEGQVNVNRTRDGGVDVAGPGGAVSVQRSGNGVSVATPDTQVNVNRNRDGSLGVSTPNGQVSIGADGIRVQGDARGRDSSARPAPAGGSTAQDPSGRGANIDETRLEQLTRPVTCRAEGTVDLDNVLLRVDGDAVSTVGGCRIHIRNSHIIGSTAIRAVGSSIVTVENSIIEGRTAFHLEGSVDMSVKSSTVRGEIQKLGSVSLRDLGSNVGLR
jgi:hypothetical protein